MITIGRTHRAADTVRIARVVCYNFTTSKYIATVNTCGAVNDYREMSNCCCRADFHFRTFRAEVEDAVAGDVHRLI